jgi:5'-nucleotidase
LFRRTTAIAAVALVAATLGGCGSDDGDSAATTTAAPETTTTAAPAPLEILVTDDDGIAAPGIDALVNAVSALDDVVVTVVAPAVNQSGSSDKTTPGGVTHADGATASGVKGTAVNGFPADSVIVALDELKLTPDLVVSGVNQGQNVGPFASLSGTVGAARTAIRRGIPAVSSSAGLGDLADYDLGAKLVAEWIEAHRAELADGSAQTATVTSFNVPGCKVGEPKDVVEVPLATAVPEGVNAFETADCAIAVAAPPTNDVEAMAGGYLAVTQVPGDL